MYLLTVDPSVRSRDSDTTNMPDILHYTESVYIVKRCCFELNLTLYLAYTISQAISRLLLTAENGVREHISPYQFYSGQSVLGIGVSPTTSGLLCHCPSTNVPYSLAPSLPRSVLSLNHHKWKVPISNIIPRDWLCHFVRLTTPFVKVRTRSLQILYYLV